MRSLPPDPNLPLELPQRLVGRGAEPPPTPPTAKAHTQAGLPWFDYYVDAKSLEGAAKLKDMESVATRGERTGEQPLPENEPVTPENVVKLRGRFKEDQARERSGAS